MKLIVGLGNIGPQYAQTRHNIGFMIADELAKRLHADWRTESKFQAAIAENQSDAGEKYLLTKPHTMMNLSGEAVQKLMQFYKIAPADVWVVCDDLDTPFGKLCIRSGGSSGGHQGLASLIEHIGTGFTRVRVGISMNDRTREPSEIYVLRPFNSDEQTQLSTLINAAATILEHQLTLDAPDESTFNLLD
jgi:peptidyl-tRNA hydrolase, PTH1 family